MDNDIFEPRNDLERQLVRAQSGEIPPEIFMEELLQSQLFMPIHEKHQIAGFQSSSSAHPLLLAGDDGMQAIALFTSPDRAKGFVKDYPGFEGGLLADLKWIVDKTGGGYGLVLNPGWPVGLEMAPEEIQQWLKQ
jgi:hypothetical protein